jgi:hypothetical protein
VLLRIIRHWRILLACSHSYSKAKHDDVPAHVLKQLLEAFRNG